jgi:NTE family protein
LSLDPMRPLLNFMSAASSVAFGVPGFFTPRATGPFAAPQASIETLSLYDTYPLRQTLKELVDFELINQHAVRLSLGAVNVQSGNSVYFDNTKTEIGPEHGKRRAAPRFSRSADSRPMVLGRRYRV